MYDKGVQAVTFHKQLLSTISVSKDLLGLTYEDIMRMPVKDFYTLLKIKSEEERKKQQYLQQQQQQSMQSLQSQNKKISFK